MEVMSVHRPCLMMSTVPLIDGSLLVNGAATLASPICSREGGGILKLRQNKIEEKKRFVFFRVVFVGLAMTSCTYSFTHA